MITEAFAVSHTQPVDAGQSSVTKALPFHINQIS